MRIIEPHQLQAQKRSRRHVRVGIVAFVGVIGLGVGGYIGFNKFSGRHSNETVVLSGQVMAAATDKPTMPKTTPKIFTGNEFKDLYRGVLAAYPNTEDFPDPPAITGNETADAHIRKLAEARGFQLTRIPVTALVKLHEPLVSGETDDLLQPPAYLAWEQIKEAAKKDNIPLALMSAYRSPEFQRNLFMERLLARGVTIQQVINGQADAAINANMEVTAVPGYSRHHTGYIVDFWCEDGSGNFGNSTCFKWLSDNNYLHAKESGWIPSYPEGADEQGPEPEPWEYAWVGHDVLYQ